MHIKTTLLGCCMASLMFVGCSKTNPMLEQHPEYIGQWKSSHSSLVIEKTGQVDYRQNVTQEQKTPDRDLKYAAKSDLKASISDFNAQQFQIGQGEFSQVFKIDRAPYQMNQKWHMQLNGDVYTKQ